MHINFINYDPRVSCHMGTDSEHHLCQAFSPLLSLSNLCSAPLLETIASGGSFCTPTRRLEDSLKIHRLTSSIARSKRLSSIHFNHTKRLSSECIHLSLERNCFTGLYVQSSGAAMELPVIHYFGNITIRCKI